jgi:excinuclease ABC subunit A
MERGEGWTYRIVEALAKSCEVDLDTVWSKLPRRSATRSSTATEGKRIAVEWGSEGSV